MSVEERNLSKTEPCKQVGQQRFARAEQVGEEQGETKRKILASSGFVFFFV
jgi:hypothetical protein